ncbi:hypothetical protein TNCV_1675021 [Trichonephila clavipes]|nr:hypothetical protein TNCV_1675021 [Trichonephila clavipes]
MGLLVVHVPIFELDQRDPRGWLKTFADQSLNVFAGMIMPDKRVLDQYEDEQHKDVPCAEGNYPVEMRV